MKASDGRATASPRARLRIHLLRTLAALATLPALACSDGSTGPPPADPGPLRVVVARAPAATGGVLLEITGSVTGPVTPVGTFRIWQQPGSAGLEVLVKGSVGTGPILQFPAADRNGVYSVRVLDAAAGAPGGYARQPTSEYDVTVQR